MFKCVGMDSLLPECLTETGCDHKCQNCDIPGCLAKLPGLSGVGHHFYWIIISQRSSSGREYLEWVLSQKDSSKMVAAVLSPLKDSGQNFLKSFQTQ